MDRHVERDATRRVARALKGKELEPAATDRQNEGRALFREPTAAFRPSAYWFWHSIPTPDVCRTQLADFKAKGIGTILIQARLAMPLDSYLSAPYLEAYRISAEIAAELGLKLGLYDDYNWISGHAGGRTVAGRDDLRERHMFWSSGSSPQGAISGIHPPFVQAMGPDIIGWQYEGGRVEWCEWTVEAAVLHPTSDIRAPDEIVDVTTHVRITDSDAVSCTYAFHGNIEVDQALTVFISARSTTSRLINYLLPKAARRFIEVGLDPLVAALDGLIPDPVGFVFYDQPAAGFYRWDQISGSLGNSLLFAPSLRQTVAERSDVSFAKALLALVRDTGRETLRIRAQFYAAYSALMNAAFFGTLRHWAETTGIVLTGHEILPHVSSFALNGGFISIDPRVAPAVDFFGIDAYRHQTAVDSNNFAAQLAPKLGDSVARSNGRSRCMVETYASAERTTVRAAGQWELTLETARAQAIRLHCLGMRQFIWHGVYQTDGRDDDPSPFVNPRFDFAPGVNFEPWWPYHDLFSDETARISAFIEPAKPRTPVAILYPLYTALAEGPRHSHATHLGAWCKELLAQGCDFMIVSEADLIAAQIRDGRLFASGLVFDAVVLPSVTVLETVETLRTLEAFRSTGGMIWSSGERLSLACDDGAAIAAPTLSYHCDTPPAAEHIANLLSSVRSSGPDIQIGSVRRPWQWVGYEEGGWWRIVLFNDGLEGVDVSITLAEGFECEEWSPNDVTITAIGAFRHLVTTIEPHAVHCLRIRAANHDAADKGTIAPLPAVDRERAITLADGWSFAPGAGADFVQISVETGWENQGFSDFSGVGVYRMMLTVETEAEWILELPQAETAVTAFLDGTPTDRRAWRPYRFTLGRLSTGTHMLELHVANTAANRYYRNTPYLGDRPDGSGLTAAPKLIPLSN